MRYDIQPLPGATAGTPRKPPSAPAKVVAGHLVSKLGRPSRSRRSLLLSLVLLIAVQCLVLGRRHADELQLAAATLVTSALIHHIGGYENIRWHDVVGDMDHNIPKKPKFHLLIPYNRPTANLCKTMLSAAILNYPPPTLISYGAPEENERLRSDLVKNTFNFLLGKEAHDDDLIVVVEEDAWFQLPAEVLINRFFHGMRDSSANLLEKYGTVQDVNSTASKPKYTQRVLFGATKECSNEPNEPACSLVPESPLPKDIYGEETDKHIEGKYNRPSYMSSSMVIGHVSDLRPIYKEATELLQVHNKKHSSQNIFSKMFGEQEAARQIYAASQSQKKSSHWSPWLPSRQSQTSLIPNITLAQDKNYEFGIDLDYRSSLFQVMNNSVKDIRFITFNHPSIIASSAKLSASTFAKPISLPPDLMIAPPPYSQHTVSSSNPNPPITALDTISDSNQATWNDLSLATNVIVPGSSVPASLNFHGSEDLLSQLWESMWFHKNSRALMRRYIRSPDGPIAAKAAAGGGDKWWDLRGGKGGVWTDKGEWLEWNEVCGTFDEEVFGDGMGGFGREDVEVGGQKVVYNAFGQVVEGKVKKPASKENKEVGK